MVVETFNCIKSLHSNWFFYTIGFLNFPSDNPLRAINFKHILIARFSASTCIIVNRKPLVDYDLVV